MTCEAYEELVAAHVDGVLSATERPEVEQHTDSCPRCAALFASESQFRSAFLARRLITPTPPDLERRLRGALTEAASPLSSWKERAAAFFSRPWLPLGFAAAGLLVAILLGRAFQTAQEPTWFTQAADTYQAAAEGRLSLAWRTEDPQTLEAAFNSSGQLDFVTHVLDLRPSGYHIEGGQIVHLNGQPVAVVLYRSNDDIIVCLRQRGMAPEIPPGGEGRKGKFVYTRAGYSLSFMQSEDHFCRLVSRLAREVFQRRLGLAPAA